MSDKHPNSKIITIHRAGSYLSRAQGKEIEEYFADSKVSIGSYFESETSTKIATGLSHEEEEALLPTLIDSESKDRDFRKKVSEYYTELDIKIPYKGRVMEIGLKLDNTKEPSEKNFPLNVSDYIQYRVAVRHPYMAPNESSAKSNPIYQFYIFDKEAVVNSNFAKTKEKDDALKLFYSIEKDPVQIKQMLLLMGKDPREFGGKNVEAQQTAALREMVETRSKTFSDIFNQENLPIRYWIQAMLKTGVLKQFGPRVEIGNESKTLIGKSMDEAISFFLDDDNSDTIIQLKALQQEEDKVTPKQVPLQTRRLNEV